MNQLRTLSKDQHELSDPIRQLKVLNAFREGSVPLFKDQMKALSLHPLQPTSLDILQVNVGKMCNQTCKHCHVDAGPDRKEIMTRDIMDACLEALRIGHFHTLDITGGAPEMNPLFRDFVTEARPLVNTIIVRSNLTIIVANKKYHSLPEFFKELQIEVISSLPFYSGSRTDAQRGQGVFESSIKALKMLNHVGYGKGDPDLRLNLVYNPTGSFLPGDQQTLEAEYKKRLKADHGIDFDQLFTITNLPISRFLKYLLDNNNLESYMERLVTAFNPSAAPAVMCRNTISVSWNGFLYDCDFNQMLDVRIEACDHIKQLDIDALLKRSVSLDQHCYGCTAGAGSSCGGRTT